MRRGATSTQSGRNHRCPAAGGDRDRDRREAATDSRGPDDARGPAGYVLPERPADEHPAREGPLQAGLQGPDAGVHPRPRDPGDRGRRNLHGLHALLRQLLDDNCVGCEKCAIVCPVDAITMVTKHGFEVKDGRVLSTTAPPMPPARPAPAVAAGPKPVPTPPATAPEPEEA
ncbi:MAG: hypothetical protein E6J96_05890 [Methanobacteriota archaeon]|nr:MAG: hypothetical protein E6J96_05890 [Euryarchaeota archaeon]